MPVEMLSMVSRYLKVEFTAGFVVLWSVIIYSVSLAAAILLRKMFPKDWLIPLIPISYQKKTK